MKALLHNRILTLLCLTLIITTIFSAACGAPSSAGIEWKEPALEALVREKLKKPKGVIAQSDLDDIWGIELFGDSHIFFNADGGYEMYDSIDGYDNFERLGNPDRIVLYQEDFGDFLLKDGTFSVGGEQYTRGSISSLSDFSNFQNLKYLHIYKNNLDDLSGLSSLENLIELMLMESAIQDVSGLAELKQIDSLILTGNQIENVSPLGNLSQLHHLRLTDNQVGSLKELASLSNLDRLIVPFNPINSLEGIEKFEHLSALNINDTRVNDISILSGKTSLSSISMEFLEANSIDLAPLSTLENLRYLYIAQDKAEIINLRSLSGLENLYHMVIREGDMSVDISEEDVKWLKEQLPGCGIEF